MRKNNTKSKMKGRDPVFAALNKAFREFDQKKSDIDIDLVRFVTGKEKEDAFLYFAEGEYGLYVEKDAIEDGAVQYEIIDEKKFTWFMMRWA